MVRVLFIVASPLQRATKKLGLNHSSNGMIWQRKKPNGKCTCVPFNFFSHFSHSKAEVSNTRPAGRMWPAKCICAARKHPKKPQNYKFCSNLASFEGFSCKLRPAKAFYYKLRPAEYFFFEMWPSDEFEFETKLGRICSNSFEFRFFEFHISNSNIEFDRILFVRSNSIKFEHFDHHLKGQSQQTFTVCAI
jgi:hypothetical protein